MQHSIPFLGLLPFSEYQFAFQSVHLSIAMICALITNRNQMECTPNQHPTDGYIEREIMQKDTNPILVVMMIICINNKQTNINNKQTEWIVNSRNNVPKRTSFCILEEWSSVHSFKLRVWESRRATSRQFRREHK